MTLNRSLIFSLLLFTSVLFNVQASSTVRMSSTTNSATSKPSTSASKPDTDTTTPMLKTTTTKRINSTTVATTTIKPTTTSFVVHTSSSASSTTTSSTTSTKVDPPFTTPTPCKRVKKKNKYGKTDEKSDPTLLIVYIALGVVALLLIISSIVLGVWCECRRSRRRREREQEVESRQEEIAEYQEQLKKGLKPKRKQNGVIATVPQGWVPDSMKASQFDHKGALKINIDKPILMAPLQEDDESTDLRSDKSFLWDDDQNVVFDMGTEVEELYKEGQKVHVPRQAKTKEAANRQPNNLRAIRED